MSTSTGHDAAMDAESKAGVPIGLSLGFSILTTLVVSCRLYVRFGILKAAGPDDWTMGTAQVLAIIVSIITIMEAENGLGSHTWTVSPERSMNQLKFLFTNVITYNLAMNIVKISFLLQYRRIFQSSTVNRVCLTAIMFVVCWAIVQDIVSGLACLPISFIVPSTTSFCLDTLTIWYLSSAISLVTDFMIFLIPIPSLVRLHLPTRQRILLVGIFGLGFFVCGISIARIFTIRTSAESQDPSWDNTETAWWSVVELNTAILCSSLPTLRPLLARVFPSFASSYGGGYSAAEAKKNFVSGTSNSNTHSGGEDMRRHGSSGSEDLILQDLERQMPITGVYAECSAERRSEELEPTLPIQSPSRQSHILVTKETSVKADDRRTITM